MCDGTWIYQYDPETKQQSAERAFKRKEPLQKDKKSESVGKVMVCSLFAKHGHIISIPLENQQTVIANWFITICLPKLLEKL